MREIDQFSRVVGAMGAFAEMVSTGCKRVALGSPVTDRSLRDEHMEFAKEICKKAGVYCCEENGGFLTDLFPAALNRDKYNVLIYKEEKDGKDYFDLKERKDRLVKEGKYDPAARREIAYEFGHLLGYQDADIQRMIDENDDKEVF